MQLSGSSRVWQIYRIFLGIRVGAVLPGVVKTPLWTDNPEKLKIVKQEGQDADVWVTPEETAEAMLALVKDDEIPSEKGGDQVPIVGGTCLEVLARYVRDVPLVNNMGPQGTGRPGHTVSGGGKLYQDAIEVLKPGWGQVKGANGA